MEKLLVGTSQIGQILGRILSPNKLSSDTLVVVMISHSHQLFLDWDGLSEMVKAMWIKHVSSNLILDKNHSSP